MNVRTLSKGIALYNDDAGFFSVNVSPQSKNLFHFSAFYDDSTHYGNLNLSSRQRSSSTAMRASIRFSEAAQTPNKALAAAKTRAEERS